jgi:hypothetical protein
MSTRSAHILDHFVTLSQSLLLSVPDLRSPPSLIGYFASIFSGAPVKWKANPLSHFNPFKANSVSKMLIIAHKQCQIKFLKRLSENAHLPRYPHPSSLRRTSMYASFLGISSRSKACGMDIFHQPLRIRFFDSLEPCFGIFKTISNDYQGLSFPTTQSLPLGGRVQILLQSE